MARPLGPQRTTPASDGPRPGGAQVTPIRPGRRITLRDDTLPHQIRIYLHTASAGKIAVSCNCKLGELGRCEPLEVRTRWEPYEPMEVWRAHMAEVDSGA